MLRGNRRRRLARRGRGPAHARADPRPGGGDPDRLPRRPRPGDRGAAGRAAPRRGGRRLITTACPDRTGRRTPGSGADTRARGAPIDEPCGNALDPPRLRRSPGLRRPRRRRRRRAADRAETVPWFASGECGGMLVAPDRILTAAHCVKGNNLAGIAGWAVGGVTRNGTQFALHPNWRETNGENLLDDVALIQLDQPVSTVAPVALGGAAPPRGWILGRGRSTAPAPARPSRSTASCARPSCGRSPTGRARRTSSTSAATAGSASTPSGWCARSTSTARRR